MHKMYACTYWLAASAALELPQAQICDFIIHHSKKIKAVTKP